MTLGRGWFDYYVYSSETERKEKTDRPFDTKWILEKVFVHVLVAAFAHVPCVSFFQFLRPLRTHNAQVAV